MSSRWVRQWVARREYGHPERTGICIVSYGITYYFYHDSDPAVTTRILGAPLTIEIPRPRKHHEQAQKDQSGPGVA
jgi:hypothetical protein